MRERSIDGETLDRMLALVIARGVSEETVRALRVSWPRVHFSFCSDDDICGVEPVKTAPGLNVYLVDGSAHCLMLTNDLDAATGLVLAEVVDDEA